MKRRVSANGKKHNSWTMELKIYTYSYNVSSKNKSLLRTRTSNSFLISRMHKGLFHLAYSISCNKNLLLKCSFVAVLSQKCLWQYPRNVSKLAKKGHVYDFLLVDSFLKFPKFYKIPTIYLLFIYIETYYRFKHTLKCTL